MKRSVKVFLAQIAALLLVVASCITSLAAATSSLKIKNAAADQGYTVYQLFDAETDGKGGVSYSFPKTKTDLYNLIKDSTVLTCSEAGDKYYVTQLTPAGGSTKEKDLREWLQANIAVLTPSSTSKGAQKLAPGAASSTLTWTTLSYGYYLVVPDGTGKKVSGISVDSKDPAVIFDKNANTPVGTLDKKSDGETTVSYQIGDDVPFEVTFTGKNYVTEEADGTTPATTSQVSKYVFKDSADSTLVYNDDIVIKVGSTEVKEYDASTAPYGYTGSISTGITIPWIKTDGSQLYADDQTVTITYTMKVAKAAATSQTNKATVNFYTVEDGDTPTPLTPDDEPKKVTVLTATVTIDKTDDSSNKLAGAKFVLLDETKTLYYTGEVKTGQALFDVKAKAKVETTTASGAASFTGLKPGTYYLFETEAPAGYVASGKYYKVEIELVDDELKMKVDGSEAAKAAIQNTKTAALPETGGNGTKLLLICGAMLFFATAIVLVTKKRQYNEG